MADGENCLERDYTKIASKVQKIDNGKFVIASKNFAKSLSTKEKSVSLRCNVCKVLRHISKETFCFSSEDIHY